MQSDLQDVPPVVKQESSTAPRPMKWIIKKPLNIAKVDGEAGDKGCIERSSNSVVLETKELLQTHSNVEDAQPMMKKECSRSPQPTKKSRKRALHEAEADSGNDGGDCGDESIGSTSNQLVLYNPGANNTNEDTIPTSDHSVSYTSTFQNILASNPLGRVLPSVGAFTVQCANCFKWRLIPTKEKYEEIRERILQWPFTCERARAWRPDITCDDPADISQDGSRLWAIDKPNIAQPPPGWERQLRIRGEGSTKFADVKNKLHQCPLLSASLLLPLLGQVRIKEDDCVRQPITMYYAAPSGKKLRSMVEVQKYLQEHPEFIEQGVKLSQFSFQIPRPLQENYVRKRPARMPNPLDGGFGLPRPLELDEVNPLSWVEPTDEDLPAPLNHGDPVNQYSPSLPPPAPSPRENKKSTKPRIYIKNSRSNSSAIMYPANEEL